LSGTRVLLRSVGDEEKRFNNLVGRLKGDDLKVANLKTHVDDIIQDVMVHSNDADRLEEAVESAIRRFETTGSFAPTAGNGGSVVKPSLTTMQLDSELSLDELVNYLKDEIDNEHRCQCCNNFLSSSLMLQHNKLNRPSLLSL
jgi:hypothetical protein